MGYNYWSTPNHNGCLVIPLKNRITKYSPWEEDNNKMDLKLAKNICKIKHTKCTDSFGTLYARASRNTDMSTFVSRMEYTGPTHIGDCTVYPKKYAHGFVVLCFVVVMQSFIMNSHEVFIHIHQGCFAGTGAIVRLKWNESNVNNFSHMTSFAHFYFH